MGIPIPMLDLMFFLTESQDNPRHVGAVLIFQRPRRGGADIVDRIVDAYRRATPVPPFNRIPVLRRAGLPEWQEVDRLDTSYHFQRRTLPAPGSDAQLDELVAELHAPMLDRRPPGLAGVPDRRPRAEPVRRLHQDPSLAGGRRVWHRPGPSVAVPLTAGPAHPHRDRDEPPAATHRADPAACCRVSSTRWRTPREYGPVDRLGVGARCSRRAWRACADSRVRRFVRSPRH